MKNMNNMKNIKVFIDGRFLGTAPVLPSATISQLKNYGISVINYNKLNPSDYIIDIFLNVNNKLDLTKIPDTYSLGTNWDLFTDPHMYIYRSKTTAKIDTNTRKGITGHKDIDGKIFLNLYYDDLKNVCQADRYTRDICNDNFWRHKVARDFPKRMLGLGLAKLYKEEPRHLYELLYRRSEVHELGEDELPKTTKFLETNEVDDLEENPTSLDEDIKKLIDDEELVLVPGDIVHLEGHDYRNDGKFIWTGTEIVPLYFNIDEYGSVPPEFKYPEYRFDHFHGAIDHNYITWLEPSVIQEFINSYNETPGKIFHGKYTSGELKFTDKITGKEVIISMLLNEKTIPTKKQFADYLKGGFIDPQEDGDILFIYPDEREFNDTEIAGHLPDLILLPIPAPTLTIPLPTVAHVAAPTSPVPKISTLPTVRK